MSPAVSVIIAAYNASKTLSDTVKSVQGQTLQDFEIIIIDDCSKDDTVAVAQKLARDDARIRVLEAPVNGGPGKARNIGLDAAKGEWIAVVDSDDIILPDRFEKMIAEGGQASIVFDNLFWQEHGVKENYVPVTADCFGNLDLKTFIRSHRRECPLDNLGFLKPLIRRSALEKHNLRYDPSLFIGEDAFLIMQLMAKGEKAYLMRDGYYQYDRRQGSISSFQNDKSVRAITNSYYRLLKENTLSHEEEKTLRALIHDNESRLASMKFLKTFPKFESFRALLPFLIFKLDPRVFAIETGVYLRDKIRSIR